MSSGPYVTLVVKLEQGKRANYSRCIHMFGDTILGLVRNFDVVQDCTSLWPVEVKMDKYGIEVGHLLIFLCQQLINGLMVGYAYIMGNAMETLVAVSLLCTSTSPKLMLWLSFSPEENAEKGIMIMEMYLYDRSRSAHQIF